MEFIFQAPEHARRLYASIHAAMMSASGRHDLVALAREKSRAQGSTAVLDPSSISVLTHFADVETERIRAIVPVVAAPPPPRRR